MEHVWNASSKYCHIFSELGNFAITNLKHLSAYLKNEDMNSYCKHYAFYLIAHLFAVLISAEMQVY